MLTVTPCSAKPRQGFLIGPATTGRAQTQVHWSTTMAEPTPIRIFDTTLRDGEQSPGATLNHQEKIEIARQLDKLGVDVIEAGFPITSQGDFDAVRAISHELTRPITAGLARCVPRDIDRAGEALRGAHN